MNMRIVFNGVVRQSSSQRRPVWRQHDSRMWRLSTYPAGSTRNYARGARSRRRKRPTRTNAVDGKTVRVRQCMSSCLAFVAVVVVIA